jgi:hypothetical protein
LNEIKSISPFAPPIVMFCSLQSKNDEKRGNQVGSRTGREMSREILHKILNGGFNTREKLILITEHIPRITLYKKHQETLYRLTMYSQLESAVMSPSCSE